MFGALAITLLLFSFHPIVFLRLRMLTAFLPLHLTSYSLSPAQSRVHTDITRVNSPSHPEVARSSSTPLASDTKGFLFHVYIACQLELPVSKRMLGLEVLRIHFRHEGRRSQLSRTTARGRLQAGSVHVPAPSGLSSSSTATATTRPLYLRPPLHHNPTYYLTWSMTDLGTGRHLW